MMMMTSFDGIMTSFKDTKRLGILDPGIENYVEEECPCDLRIS